MRVRTAAVLLFAITIAASCRTAGPSPHVVQPGAPGQPSKSDSAKPATPPAFTDADVKFMQGMIHHHSQALEMVALLKDRTNSEDMKMLAQRIEVSQGDEIKLMQRWLQARGQEVPMVHAMVPGSPPMPGMATMTMPGMLTAEQMAKLTAAKGPEFDRLFLEFMIQHHEGALVMVKDLFNSPGAAQQAEIFSFASDVEADQLIEIRRMRGMLGR